MGRWQPGADGGAMARCCCPSTTRFQRAVPLPMASPQGGSAMAAPHPKADVRIILSYIIGPCSKLADGTYSNLRPAARRHLPGVRYRPTAAPPHRRLDTGNAAMQLGRASCWERGCQYV